MMDKIQKKSATTIEAKVAILEYCQETLHLNNAGFANNFVAKSMV